jgi:hypothetical protein
MIESTFANVRCRRWTKRSGVARQLAALHDVASQSRSVKHCIAHRLAGDARLIPDFRQYLLRELMLE